jgi:hypothetical protein
VNSSLGVVKVRPSIDINTWCPLPVGPRCSEELPSGGAREGPCRAARGHLRSGDATFRTRSALAVLPGCDGLLHLVPSRFVAPWCRSWGSPGCCFSNHFQALSRGSSVRLHRIPAWPFPSPRGDRSGLRRAGLSVSSEEATCTPLRRPALPLAAWAFPLALHPSKLFPCRQLVPRQPCRARAPQSVPELPGEPGNSFPCTTLHSSGAGHRGPFPLAVACDSCAPSGYHPRADGAFPVCRGRSLDLRALFHRQVRNDSPTFPPDRRPMLPWASSIEGLLSPCVDRSPDAVADVPEHPTGGHRSILCVVCGRAFDHPSRSRFPWRTSSVVVREPAVFRLLACSRLPKLAGTCRPDRRPTPEGAPSPKEAVLDVPSSGFAQRRLRGDSVCPGPIRRCLHAPKGVRAPMSRPLGSRCGLHRAEAVSMPVSSACASSSGRSRRWERGGPSGGGTFRDAASCTSPTRRCAADACLRLPELPRLPCPGSSSRGSWMPVPGS